MQFILLVNEYSLDVEVFNREWQLFTQPYTIELICFVTDPSLGIVERFYDCKLVCNALVKLDAEVVDVIELEAYK